MSTKDTWRDSGTIKVYFDTKAYGFVAGDDGVDRFFHINGVDENIDPADLKPGRQVTFISISHDRGDRAADVRLVEVPQ